jgi:hypothetical protein
MKAKQRCVNSSAERKANGTRPYHAPTRKEHPTLAAYHAACRQRGIRPGY